MLNDAGQDVEELAITPENLVGLTKQVDDGVINSNIAKQVVVEMFESGETAGSVIERLGLAQISDDSVIKEAVSQAIADNPDKVQAYLGGRDKLKGFFVGQVMRATQGKANPVVVNKLIDEAFESFSHIQQVIT